MAGAHVVESHKSVFASRQVPVVVQGTINTVPEGHYTTKVFYLPESYGRFRKGMDITKCISAPQMLFGSPQDDKEVKTVDTAQIYKGP